MLPSDLESLVTCLGEAVIAAAEGKAFAMCGWSSGGWLANAVAAWLEQRGVAPLAVVFFDSRKVPADWMAPDPETEMSLMRSHIFPLPGSGAATSDPACDEELTAWVAYWTLFETWTPNHLVAKTLMLVPTDGLSSLDERDPSDDQTIDERLLLAVDEDALRGDRALTDSDEVLEVRGNHMSIMMEHAHETAGVVEHWLTQTVRGHE